MAWQKRSTGPAHTCGGPVFGRLTAGCPRCDELGAVSRPAPAQPKVTAHTCGGPKFGRKTPGCPRCDELLAGAEPVRWGNGVRPERGGGTRRQQAEWHLADVRGHLASDGHRNGGCGPVCTYGEW